jgi:hypothetical protein
MGSDAERTTVAMKLFGTSGAALIPLLEGGSEGAKKMFAEFERLGGAMSKDFVAAAPRSRRRDRQGQQVAFANWKTQISFALRAIVTRMATKLQG